jgi:hypothetical protein
LYSISDFNGSSGFPFPDVEFKFENGAIFVKTPEYRTIRRYFGDPDDRIIEWYESGDLGYMKDGELYITGRSNDRINIGGIKVDPKLIEDIVKTIDGVTDCMVYQDTNLDILEQMCIIVISDKDVSKQIYDRCVDGIGLAKTPKNIYYADELPIKILDIPTAVFAPQADVPTPIAIILLAFELYAPVPGPIKRELHTLDELLPAVQPMNNELDTLDEAYPALEPVNNELDTVFALQPALSPRNDEFVT